MGGGVQSVAMVRKPSDNLENDNLEETPVPPKQVATRATTEVWGGTSGGIGGQITGNGWWGLASTAGPV